MRRPTRRVGPSVPTAPVPPSTDERGDPEGYAVSSGLGDYGDVSGAPPDHEDIEVLHNAAAIVAVYEWADAVILGSADYDGHQECV